MNMNQLFSMFTRILARRAMNWGINKGMGRLSRGKQQPGAGGPKGKRPAATNSNELAKRLRTLSRLTRR